MILGRASERLQLLTLQQLMRSQQIGLQLRMCYLRGPKELANVLCAQEVSTSGILYHF